MGWQRDSFGLTSLQSAAWALEDGELHSSGGC
jgi:hypothetical protein